MQIHANCEYDFEACQALTYIALYRKKDPSRCFTRNNILLAILFAVVLLDMILFGPEKEFIILMIAIVIMGILDWFLYYQYPKINYRSLANFKNVSNEFVFTEEKLLVTSHNNEYSGQCEIAYSLFVKAYETSRYLFLYQTNNQVFIIDKSTLTNGTIEEIRTTLSQYFQKYYICKY